MITFEAMDIEKGSEEIEIKLVRLEIRNATLDLTCGYRVVFLRYKNDF